MNKIITLFVCLALFFNLFTPIRAFVSGGVALSMLIPVVLMFFFDKLFARKQIISVTIVVMIYLLLSYMGVEYFSGAIPKCIVLLFAVFSLEHYFISKDKLYAKFVVATVYLTLFFLIIVSIPQFILIPNLTRMMLLSAEDPSIELQYYWAISYETVHNLPVLSIPLFGCINMLNKRWKMFGVIGLVLIMVVMVLASSATSLILLVITYLFFILYNSKKTLSSNIFKFAVVGLLFIPIMSTSVQLSILNTIQPVFEGSNTSAKIDEIKFYIMYGNTSGDMEAREDVYQKTIDGIVSNPLFPETNNNKIGLHSYLLDHFSAMGLFLFIPFAWFLFSRFKRINIKLPHSQLYTTTSFVSLIILATFKNFFVITSSLFIVPLAMDIIVNNYKKNKS